MAKTSEKKRLARDHRSVCGCSAECAPNVEVCSHRKEAQREKMKASVIMMTHTGPMVLSWIPALSAGLLRFLPFA